MPVKTPGLVELDMSRLLDELDRKRASRHMRLADVAAVLGVHPVTISKWNRESGMNSAVALRLAIWLDIDLRDYARQDPLPVTQSDAA
jgi:transcriptional regulator with XRE-family HTH domain